MIFKKFFIIFLFSSLLAFGGDFCIFPFENLTPGQSGNFGYTVEVFLECCLDSSMCHRVEAIEGLDLPLDGDFTYATQLIIAEKTGAKYLVNGSYFSLNGKTELTVRVFELNGGMKKYSFGGNDKEIFEKLEDIAIGLGGKRFWDGDFDYEKFGVFSSVLTLACVYRDFSPALKKADFFKGDDFYSRRLFKVLYRLEEYSVAYKYFENIGEKDWRDFLFSGLIKVREGDFDKAESLFKKGNSLNPSDIFLNNIAGCMVLKGETKPALSVLEGAGGAYSNFNKSLCFALDNDFGNALRFLAEFSSEYGLDENGRLLLSYILEGKKVNARMFEKGVSRNDIKEIFVFNDGETELENVSEILENYKKIGLNALKNKDFPKAKEYLEKYFVLNPFDREVCNALCSLSAESDACLFLSLGE